MYPPRREGQGGQRHQPALQQLGEGIGDVAWWPAGGSHRATGDLPVPLSPAEGCR